MENLLRELKNKNISVSLSKGDLKVRYNGADLTDDLVKILKDNKDHIIKYLELLNRNTGSASIKPVDESEHYVLSSSQRRLIILNQFEDGAIAYNLPGVYIFEGDLNRKALDNALKTLIERHEILRTTFREDEKGEVRQCINHAQKAIPRIASRDVRREENKDQLINDLLHEQLAEPFDLASGPLLRLGLYQLTDNKWVFFYVMHHIITDGWSMGILIRELLLLYNAYARGGENPLPDLPIQYKDYAAWQQEQLQGGALLLHKEYWLKQMEGGLPVLELPADRPRQGIKTYKGRLISKKIPDDLSKKIKELANEQGCTMFMGLLAAVNALLYKYTGQEDIIIGTTIAGREHMDLEEQIGFYVNALALRSRFSGKDSSRTLLQHIRKITIDAYGHQMYPFDELVHALRLDRDMSRNPLFDVFIDFHDAGVSSQIKHERMGSLDIGVYEWDEQVISKFDLTFIFIDAGGELQLSLEYNSDLFEPETIERLCLHFENLLRSMVTFPGQTLSRLEYMDKEEKTRLLEFSAPAEAPIPYKSVIALFREQVSNAPENTALLFNNISFTYRELDEQSNGLANNLVEKYCIKPGDRIGIMLDRSEKMLIAILAVCKSGGVYVPVDPAYPETRKEYIIKDSGARMLLTQTDYIFGLEYFDGEIFSMDVELDGIQSSNAAPGVNNNVSDIAYVIYTSGSTGEPKGCAITHESLSNYIQWANGYYFRKKNKPVFGLYTSLSFDLTITSIFCSLTTGGSLLVYNQYMETEEILKHIFSAESGIDSIKLTPSHINLLKNSDISATGIVCAIVGGEQLTAEQVSILKKINPFMEIFNEYGPTEATVGCIVKQIEEHVPVVIGKPINGARIYILGEENTLSAFNVPGEICIGGKGLAKEYLNKPGLTMEKFVADPFKAGEKIYRSGDLGRWLPGGDIAFIGRKDEQVKIQGHRIEPGEIEVALKTYDAVTAACVSARNDKEGTTELIAYMVSDKSIEPSDVRLHLSERLPSYMIPRYFVQLAKLPLTPNGKIDRQHLPAPEELDYKTSAEYMPPANETEEKLVAIWQEVLGGGTIGVRDNFFDLGGNSLKLVRLVSLVNRAFDKKLTVVQLFRYPNIRVLAEFLESGEANNTEEPDNMAKMAKNIMEETLKAIR